MRIPTVLALALLMTSAPLFADWSADPVWHDGLVEKATYKAERVIYGKARPYEAIFLTNKEQHDVQSLTKARSADRTVEVWKQNQVERVPTPNYDYTFIATSHLRVSDLLLTRLDVSSQEWCGTSFKQLLLKTGPRGNHSWSASGFSYMPGTGTAGETIESGRLAVVPFNALPLYLRNYDFANKPAVELMMVPDQKSNRQTPLTPRPASIRYAGESDAGHQLELSVDGRKYGVFTFARDRLHIMTRYEGADGLKYELQSVDRVNYWTIEEE
jgi:hypothetical protein